MKVRITFRSEIYLEGDSLQEIRRKWENLNLFDKESKEKYSIEFIEETSVEDADTFENLKNKF